MPSKHAALAAHVRRLCSLGAEPRVIIPHVVETIRVLVGADWGMFFYSNDDYSLSDMFSQNDAIYDVMSNYMSEVHNTEKQTDVMGVDFSTAMRRGRGYENTARNDAALLESAMYNELYRPLQIRHSLESTAFDGRRSWGSFTLKRMPGGRPFSERDVADVRPLTRHIAHAMARPNVTFLNHSDQSRSSVIVADASGKIILQNGSGGRILALASGETNTYLRRSHLPVWLMPSVTCFNRIQRGCEAAPPMQERYNAAGRFTFKAYRFDDPGALTDRATIAIYAEHFPPLALQIETLGFQLGLSERQRQLCTWLMLERSHIEIAQLMGIRESTVVDHVRKVYRKLDVHGHDQLRTAFREASTGMRK
jgi:DNA-binding CsgD family transcriptional regulator